MDPLGRTGTYGGNDVTCGTLISQEPLSTVGECEFNCLTSVGSARCEAYKMDDEPGNCFLMARCDGRYIKTESVKVQVGYCIRIDNPPLVRLDDGACCTSVLDKWVEPPYRCIDVEDPVPPTVNRVTVYQFDDVTGIGSPPGTYIITYICTDLKGQTDTKTRELNVTSLCDPSEDPPVEGDTTENATCVQAQVKAGGICDAVCPFGSFPDPAQVLCEQIGTSPDVRWRGAFKCLPKPCPAPLGILNVREHPDKQELVACAGYDQEVPHNKLCIPNCITNYVGSVIGGLKCRFGKFQGPQTYTCLQKAETPVAIRSSAWQHSFMDLEWGAGFSHA